MPIPEKKLLKFREALLSSHRPLFFFDDDPDGLCSFLLLYRKVKEGKGIIKKSKPYLVRDFSAKVREYQPDRVFILDIPDVEQEFIDQAKSEIFWLDHHQPVKRHNTMYFNPMLQDGKDNRPVSYWCYKIIEQDLWLGMVGCVGDWFLPDFSRQFANQYPKLLPEVVDKPEEVLYTTQLGKLVRIFSFLLKGRTKEVMTLVKILTRIEDPYEILDQTSRKGRFLYNYYYKINKLYEELLMGVRDPDDELLVFLYPGNKQSFTSDLSNELLYRYPEHIILVGRKHNGEVKCSLRTATKKLLPLLEKALIGIDGYGGGHELACGACIKQYDFERFLINFKAAI